jgi:hypothetical protein
MVILPVDKEKAYLQYTNKSLKNYAKLPSLSYELYIQYIQQ